MCGYALVIPSSYSLYNHSLRIGRDSPPLPHPPFGNESSELGGLLQQSIRIGTGVAQT